MPTKPKVKQFTGSGIDVLNAIRNGASVNYREYVPVVHDASDIKEVGNVLMQFPTLQNEFIDSLINRIARVIVTSKMWTNPLAVFKKGYIETGETVEEIFVNIAKPFEFDPEKAETNLYKREIPDVKSAFHVLNYKKFYKQTISQEQLRTAFTSLDGVDDLIARIVDGMYTGAAYDEFNVTKYLLCKKALNGQMYPVPVKTTADNTVDYTQLIVEARKLSNNFTFENNKYNITGVYNNTPRDDQYIFIDSDVDAHVSVEVLAKAFNMSETEFIGHEIVVDSFVPDTDRLNQLFTDQNGNYINNYKPLTDAEINTLNNIPAMLVDRDFFMLFDNLEQFGENWNGEGLYWQYFYHTWKTVSSSPFAQSAVFTTTLPIVQELTITPETANAKAGQQVQLSASVTTGGFASQAVNWTVDDPAKALVNGAGLVTILGTATGDVTVTATSVADPTKKAVATITVTA